ncbi:hypothetical protein P1J78_24615 [Psychromarinibacter sp. C21-152]|uniref:Uncharacterized protein n=1 Tax=Psychromarinibacter sediminicola TaxID=3033385 RepID=A0AAE3NXQ3_9RHOB|nr:hypothetical protein [Psychromarinibacter sediminicola]MDF0603901.1 hypothetical protein [Psychromarinibacter sediminicola]
MARPFEDPEPPTETAHWMSWTARPKGRALQINNYLSAAVFALSALVTVMQYGA